MNISERLHRYGLGSKHAHSDLSTSFPPTASDPDRDGEDLLPGQQLGGGERGHVAESGWPAHVSHGLHSFSGLDGLTGEQLALITRDPELAYVDLSRPLFLDTETTGLGMGMGTYVFLVGAGYFDGQSFRVRQFFLPGPQNEYGFLRELASFLRQFSVVISFNGKAFDWPLLENRFVRWAIDLPLIDPPHLDLLYPARKLWKRRLESCTLSSLEANILRVERSEQDVPGWTIPSLYFSYVRTGQTQGLRRIFYHNLQDVLSLAALTIHVERVVADPLGGLVTHPVDFVSLGRAYERAGHRPGALLCYQEALRSGLNAELRGACIHRLGLIYKRDQQWQMALNSWEQLYEEGGHHSLHALIEMAKYHEHVARDYEEAIDATRQAMRLSELHEVEISEPTQFELQHRLLRLIAKQQRAAGYTRAHRYLYR